jgi:hypothetical protein
MAENHYKSEFLLGKIVSKHIFGDLRLNSVTMATDIPLFSA